MKLSPWSPTLKIIAGSFHGVAIVCTVFRLIYRWYVVRFWWEDGWAAVALAANFVCLVSAMLEAPATDPEVTPIDNLTNWMAALGFPCVLWACRASILFSIVRIANPSPELRRIAFLVGCSFVVMWAALMGQKIHLCANDHCIVAGSVGLSQLITDAISDSALVVLPIFFFRRTNITYRQRIMIFSIFSTSLSITGVTILHSVALFTVVSNGTIVIGHVKTALSLIVCNLLVIVAFMHRVYRRGKMGNLDTELNTFTSVDLSTGLAESGIDKHMTGSVQSSMVSEESRWTAVISMGTMETSSKPAR